MPFESNDDLPEAVRSKYDEKEQEIFRKAFNAAWDGTCKEREDREECCFKIAHSAVENALKEERKEQNAFEWEKPRYFNLDLCGRKFKQVDGTLRVNDVIALAEGTWTDSNVRTPCRYTPKILSDKTSFKDNGMWSRHAGGVSRSANDKIGYFEDAGYSEKHKARMVNLVFHLKSQMSRDIAEMVEAGIINAVSAEIGGDEWYNPKTKEYEALTIDFYGLATVDRGACEACLIRHKSAPEPDVSTPSGEEEQTMEMEEIEKELADLKAKVADLMAKVAELMKPPEPDTEASEPSKGDKVGELSEKMNEELRKFGERLGALEKKPDARTLARTEEGRVYI